MATIGFNTVQAYLTAIAKANGNIDVSPHQAFWLVTYEQFVGGTLPGPTYRGASIPLIWKDAPVLSPFFMILVEPKGWGGKRQMPPGGPDLSKDEVNVTLDDGSTVTTKKIRDDIQGWLENGFPKDPVA
jgi:hypothetical protein